MRNARVLMAMLAGVFLLPLLGFVIMPGKKLNAPFKQMGYGETGLFLYRVTETDSKGRLIHEDTLGLYCSEALNEQSVMQWQIMRRQNGELVPDEKSYDGSTTVNDITDSILFIHPPRHDRYRILQFCPYPYFVNGTKEGAWTWDFAVGAYWTTPPVYPIRKVDTFHIVYSSKGEGSMRIAQGELKVSFVSAVSKSKYGRATSEFVLHEKYGMVEWTAIPANGHAFHFGLVAARHGTNAIASNRQFAYNNAEREKKIRRATTKKTMNYLGVSGGQ